MTNDDRSNEDRTGDGQVPSWGEAPRYGEQAPQGEPPRYGEQAAQPEAPRYGSTEYAEQQGQYGRPDDAQPQYGQQQQYGQQPYAAAAAPTSAGAPSWQGYEEPKRKKKTVGAIAFVVGLLALVAGVVAGVLIGAAFGDSAALREAANGGSTTPSDSAVQELMTSPGAVTASLLFYLGTALGLWAIVQGIIAAVTKRGRAWGVWGIVLAVVGVIAFFIAAAASVAGAMGGSV
ncbi:DUF4064 domain-containing protein [Curtobacterium pusillum]|uniref:DUF4064 domain-containing protein n=1 Tax=Curtobacterium pusillum TaxID=69373 RepID=UPI0011AAFFBD|nr:DUF4064 domain-containing protein [Curtobacterium pusillum]